ncbi:MAG: polysaccharide biosynthesis tyrosine autokinase [Bacteroidota bacterium]
MEQQTFQSTLEQEKDFLDSFDLERFWYVFKQSKLWIVLFILVSTVVAYLYVRYTKPVFRAESIVKLDFQSEANILGITNVVNSQDRNILSGEIELIRSRLFLKRVLKQANLNVSYHLYGRIQTDERYQNSPFAVSYKIRNPKFYDSPFDIELMDEEQFRLTYEYNGETHTNEYRYGQNIETNSFNLLLNKTQNFNSELLGKQFYFQINSEGYLFSFLQRNLEVAPENLNAKTIKIAFSDYKARKARDLVRLIDSLYLNYTKEVKNQAIEQKVEFLESQIEETENTLSNFEQYFEDFTIKNRTTNLGQDLNRTISQLYKIDSQRFLLRAALTDLSTIEEKMKAKGAVIIDPISAGNLPKALITALANFIDLQQERELKLVSYNETSYLIQQLDLKLDKASASLARLLDSYRGLLKNQLKEVETRRNHFESSLYQLPSMGTEYTKKRRLYGLQEDLLLSLQTSKMELELTMAGTVTKNIILSPASLPSVPVKPQKLLIIAAGFIIGLVLSIVFLLSKYLIHNKIAGLRELERMVNVPVLGGVPDLRRKLEKTALVVKEDSTSSISEALRTIRTNMDFLGNGKKTKVISITSTISGEGKTFVAVNLGAIMSMSGKKVVIVDLDMRKPKVHVAFSQDNKSKGVSTILAGKDQTFDFSKSATVSNLCFIPAGPVPPNPSELLMQDTFDELLEKLKAQFDIVILDTPPVGLVTDGRIVMKKSDIQLYIVRADYSKRSFASVMNDLHASKQYKNMATILNSIDNTPMYGYGYGYGYGYYEEEKSKIKRMASEFKAFF